MSVAMTIAIGAVLVMVFVGIDVYLVLDRVPGNTWSEIMRDWSVSSPVAPWVCGIIMGHFFHPDTIASPLLGQPSSVALLIWMTVIVLICGMAANRLGFPIEPWIPILPAFVVGALLWPT